MRLLLDDSVDMGGGAPVDTSTDMGSGSPTPQVDQMALLHDASMLRSGDYVGGGAALTGIAATQAGVDPNAVATGQALLSMFAPQRQKAQVQTPLALPAQTLPARTHAASGGLGWIAAAVALAFLGYMASKK